METLFLMFTCEASHRSAVIAEEIGSVWLYLSRPHERAPERDCWLLNADADADHDREFYRQHQSPPPAPSTHVAAAGTMPVPAGERWSVLWSADGHSVAALLDGKAIGFIVSGHQRGNARHIAEGAVPWALPWSDNAYNETFGDR